MRANSDDWRRRHRCRAFTFVELMVACLIVTLIMGAVVSSLSMALRTEAEAAKRWKDRAAATAVADSVATAVASGIDLRELPLAAARSRDGGHQFLCTVAVGRGLRRVRYAWRGGPTGQSPPGSASAAAGHPAAGTSSAVVVTLQESPFAGPTSLAESSGGGVGEADGATAEPDWTTVPSVLLSDRLDDLSVSFRAANGPADAWREDRAEAVAGSVVRVRARAGITVVERIVFPRVTAALDGNEKGGGG